MRTSGRTLLTTSAPGASTLSRGPATCASSTPTRLRPRMAGSWRADRFVIAVGGRASRLPIPGAELALTFEDVRSLTALPERVCVIGAADTGCQLASILADFGCRVWLLEYAPRIVPRADEDVSAGLEQPSGIAASRSSRAPRSSGSSRSRPACGSSTQPATRQGASMSMPPSSPSAGPATPTSSTPPPPAWRSSAATSSWTTTFARASRTSSPPATWTGNSMLVSSALLEGRVAAENAVLGPRRRIVHEVVPTGSFTDPEYASVGLTEAQARDRYDCAVAVARYEDLLRPLPTGSRRASAS